MEEKGRDGKVYSTCKKDCHTQMSGRWLETNESSPLVTSLAMPREKKVHVSLFSLSERPLCLV